MIWFISPLDNLSGVKRSAFIPLLKMNNSVKSISDMKKHIVRIYELVDKFETLQVTMRDGKVFTYVLSNEVQKAIKY